MELYAIMFSIPVAFVTSMAYCALLPAIVRKFEWLRRFLCASSFFILGLFLFEVVFLLSLGAVRSRAVIGPAFYVIHVFLFFLGTPALASVLVLRKPHSIIGRIFRKWYVAGTVCAIFGFLLVLLQYEVSESLYGINGNDGPYSMIDIDYLANPGKSFSNSRSWEMGCPRFSVRLE